MWLALERILAVLIGLVFFTQVVVPVIANKPVFWLFRKSTRAAAKLRRAQQEEKEAQLQLEAAQREAHTLQLRQQAEAAEQAAVNNYINDKLH